MKKRRVGRPKLGPTRKKALTIKVSVNLSERQALEEQAAGRPLSAYLRAKGLNQA